MNWWEAIHVALSVACAVWVFADSDDEAWWARLANAGFFGLFWLPVLILLAIVVFYDWVGDKVRGLRQ